MWQLRKRSLKQIWISLQLAPTHELRINNVTQPDLTPPNHSTFIEKSVLKTVDDLYSWVRLSRWWLLMFGTTCCFISFASYLGSLFDFEGFGFKPWASPRPADVIISAGTITSKMADALVRLYEQMPAPKYIIAMGACPITGRMFSADSPTAVRGVDKLIPGNVYLPCCPPRPEVIIDAIIKLRKKAANESM